MTRSESQGGFNVTSLAIDKDNNIWMTGIDIYLYDRNKKSSIKYSSDITGAIGQPGGVVVDHNGVKWFGTRGSVVSYDNKYWNVYPYIEKDEYDKLTAFSVDESGDIWMGRGNGVSIPKGYGLWRLNPTITAVNEDISLPQAIKITGNSPNPFNPSTTISYSLSSSSQTELTIYSSTGQKIRSLVSSSQTAGMHSIVWDGRDDSGHAVTSGVYFSRLITGKQTATGKMLLLR